MKCCSTSDPCKTPNYCNEGGLDRTIRIIAGGLIIYYFVIVQSINWGWLGLIPLLTGLFGYCPLYTILKINTCCKTGEKKKEK